MIYQTFFIDLKCLQGTAMIYSLQNKIFIDLKYFVGRGASSFWSLDSSKPGKRLREFWWISSSSFQSWCLQNVMMINLPTMFGTDFWMMDGKLLGFLQSVWIHRICPRKRRRRRWKGQRDPQRSLCPRMRLWKPHQVQNPSVGRAGCLPKRFFCCLLKFSEFS